MEWLKCNYKSEPDSIIQKETFWESYKTSHSHCDDEGSRSLFFGLLGIAFPLAGFSQTICVVKRKGRAFGYRDLALKHKTQASPSLNLNALAKWMMDSYSEGSEEDVISKGDIWAHFQEENAVPDECRGLFFSYLGQHIITAEPFRKVSVQIERRKRIGYCFLRRKQPHNMAHKFMVENTKNQASTKNAEKDPQRQMRERIHSVIDVYQSKLPRIDNEDELQCVEGKEEPSSSSVIDDHITDFDIDEATGKHDFKDNSDWSHSDGEREDSESDKDHEIEEPFDNYDDDDDDDYDDYDEDDEKEKDPDCEIVGESKMASSSPVENDKDNAEELYRKHHKSLKKLLAGQLPGKPKSFQEFLEKIFPISEGEASEPVKSAGKSASLLVSRMRSFLAVSFPPVTVGSLASEHIRHTEQGKLFPQKEKFDWCYADVHHIRAQFMVDIVTFGK